MSYTNPPKCTAMSLTAKEKCSVCEKGYRVNKVGKCCYKGCSECSEPDQCSVCAPGFVMEESIGRCISEQTKAYLTHIEAGPNWYSGDDNTEAAFRKYSEALGGDFLDSYTDEKGAVIKTGMREKIYEEDRNFVLADDNTRYHGYFVV